MDRLAAKIARHPFVAARLDADGRIVEACQHRHGRAYSDAIACARTHGWDGFAEMLIDADQPVQPLDVWRFDQRGGGATHLYRLGVITGGDVVLARPRL